MEKEFYKNLFQGNEKSLDLFLVFDNSQVIFSSGNWQGRLSEEASWENYLSNFKGLVIDINSFFNDSSQTHFRSLSNYDQKLGLQIWVEGKVVEGKGKICVANGKYIEGVSFLSSELLLDNEQSISLGQEDVTAFLKGKLEFDQQVNEVSAAFLNASEDEWDKVFLKALAMVVKFQGADVGNFFYVNHELEQLECFFEYKANPDAGLLKINQTISIVGQKSFLSHLKSAGFIAVGDLKKSIYKDSFEALIAEKFGFTAYIIVPIFADNNLLGLFTLSSAKAQPNWTPNHKNRFGIRQLADVFGAAVINRSTKSKLFRNEKLLSSTEVLAKSGSWRLQNTGRKIFLSKGINRIFDLDPSLDVLEVGELLSLISSPDRERVKAKVQEALAHRKSVSGEFVFTNPNGKEKHISYLIQINQLTAKSNLEVFGYCNDITEKKTVERRLLFESQILAQVNEPIYVTDLSLNVVYMNEVAIFEGEPTQNGQGGKISDFFKITNDPNISFQQLIEIASESGICVEELQILDNSGKVQPYEVSVKPIQNAEIEKIGYSFLMRNLTTKIQREEMAKKAKLIIENSPAVLFEVEPNEGFKISYITENINQFGYLAENLVEEAQSLKDFIHPEDHCTFEKELLQGERTQYSREYRFLTADGDYKWVEDKIRPKFDAEGNVVLYEGLFHDVSDRRKDRLEIEKIQDRYRVLASNIPFTNVFLIDKSLRYLVAEGLNFDNWGFDKSYFEGRKISEVHTVTRKVVEPLVTNAVEKKKTLSDTLNYLGRIYELTAKPIFKDDHLEYILGIVRDITEEYVAKKELKKSEIKYRSLVEESTEIIFSITAQLELSYVSPNIKQFLGYETYEFTSGDFTDYLHPEDAQVLQNGNVSSINYFKEHPIFEFRLRHRKGHYRIFSSSGKVIRDEKNEIRYYTGIARDITKLKETQKELYKAKERAEAALNAKSQFLSVMSHEIRTPMNAVIGLSHLLIEDNPREDQLENLRTLQFSAENLLGLINDILDFNKIDSGKLILERVPFEPKNLINRIIHSYSYQIRDKALEIIYEPDFSIPNTLVGDPVRIAQILNNLISNAIKFTDKGFIKIILELVNKESDHVNIRFTVKDSGIGVAPSKVDSIFDAFTQASSDTTRKYGGTGLGLAIVKKLTKLFGTEIHLESKLGEGSTFWFDIRFKVQQESMRKSKAKKVVKDDHLGDKRILVAEDNLVNQVLLRKYLSKWGVGEIKFADNGKIALDLFVKNDFDLVLLDLQMPEMDGFEVAKIIRKLDLVAKRNVPIIALTASSLLEVKDQLEASGMDDYVSKPFTPENLYGKIINYL
ncbi:PAS domain S-box protein [Cyclobacterium marinum]|uniref:histidine kinase n=1 Tax=Cyclobacterium marinum (strain ATCC 25205 / DSM 745 / LMG 13164 / NCIMB 1802) TaxID=880070 RepID=G0J5A6_CYCMS|nr:PAS domain S-box protein [Cyclobacterium marinum]AEL26790.1 PAS/PAC sensor hybrid histidine kinase [Cyclobacterium marinum DSM 745]